jgi:hypothetical protein
VARAVTIPVAPTTQPALSVVPATQPVAKAVTIPVAPATQPVLSVVPSVSRLTPLKLDWAAQWQWQMYRGPDGSGQYPGLDGAPDPAMLRGGPGGADLEAAVEPLCPDR